MFVPPAGRTTLVEGDSTVQCLTMPEKPPTPEATKKWRKTKFEEAGVRVIHPGLVDDMKKVDPYTKFGKVTQDSDRVHNVFGHGPQTSFEDYTNSEAERSYASKRMEPLGKSYVREHQLPAETKSRDFAFGICAGESESSKNLLYPTVTEDESKYTATYR